MVNYKKIYTNLRKRYNIYMIESNHIKYILGFL
jgi:hypothetical protein